MITRTDYAFLAALLQERTGLHIGEGKEYLVESRLRPIAAAAGCDGVSGLLARLRRNASVELVRVVCEAMATHESSFFRDGVPFELLRSTVLPRLIENRGCDARLRIWSAAASTGQEAFSLAMIVDDLPVGKWEIEILATDYSRVALDRARAGIYNTFEIQRGLSAEQQKRFCTPYGPDWRIRDSTRSRVRFAELNLIHSFGHLGSFDLILCRNVLIYFDVATRRDVLERLAACLRPGGYLLLGAAESALGLTDRVARVTDLPTSIYQRAPVAIPSLVY